MKTNNGYVNFWGKTLPEFTEMELALMEGGHCLTQPVEVKMSFIKSLVDHKQIEKQNASK